MVPGKEGRDIGGNSLRRFERHGLHDLRDYNDRGRGESERHHLQIFPIFLLSSHLERCTLLKGRCSTRRSRDEEENRSGRSAVQRSRQSCLRNASIITPADLREHRLFVIECDCNREHNEGFIIFLRRIY